MNNAYLEVISLVERLHRHFLEVVKLELEGLGIHDINNVQGMMLFNIGVAEMTVGELTLRGCYLGSNVSYNVKKMVENGYLAQQRQLADGHFRVADVEQHHSLDIVDVMNSKPFELEFHDFQEVTMKALDERNYFKICVIHAGLAWRR